MYPIPTHSYHNFFFPETRFRSYPREEGKSRIFSYPLIDMAADDKDKQKQKASASGPTDWNKMEIKFKNPEFKVRRAVCGSATKNPLKRAHKLGAKTFAGKAFFTDCRLIKIPSARRQLSEFPPPVSALFQGFFEQACLEEPQADLQR